MSRKVAAVLCACLLMPKSARASMFGEENAALSALVAQGLQEITQLSSIIANIKTIVQATNEALALAREAKRAYDMVVTYSSADLARDARVGLYQAFPELRDLGQESAVAFRNGRALAERDGSFFQLYTTHDAAGARLMRASYRSALDTTIFKPFMDAQSLRGEPSAIEQLVEQRYRRTGDIKRRAVQNTAMKVLAQKAEALSKSAEATEKLHTRALATSATANVQTMRDQRELLNHKEQEVAEEERKHIARLALSEELKQAFEDSADELILGPGEGQR